eukprot:CAMPEP_0113673494 /NCGR_PEP_ID=MMETSP0038_2-20120614/6890_1 /TAXON_ID=2898 /ORGANISM="Cryptomonas paramecium" /LENGTH=410 /DNA_ID=CAMNT_0000589961 /DNA_START=11 /DNA_END=1239 /DNA_ORIENTATION=+ /assembly_acc=CAM_ASM_000170
MARSKVRDVGTLAITISFVAAIAVLGIVWHLPRQDELVSIPDVLSMDVNSFPRIPNLKSNAHMRMATQRFRSRTAKLNFKHPFSSFEEVDEAQPAVPDNLSNDVPEASSLPPEDAVESQPASPAGESSSTSEVSSDADAAQPDDAELPPSDVPSEPEAEPENEPSSESSDADVSPPSDILPEEAPSGPEGGEKAEAAAAQPEEEDEEVVSNDDSWAPEEEKNNLSAEEQYIRLHPVFTRCYKKVDLASFSEEIRRTCGDIHELEDAAAPCHAAMSLASARFGCCWETVMEGLEAFAPSAYQSWRLWQGLLSGKFGIQFADTSCGDSVGEVPFNELSGRVDSLESSTDDEQAAINAIVMHLYRNSHMFHPNHFAAPKKAGATLRLQQKAETAEGGGEEAAAPAAGADEEEA